MRLPAALLFLVASHPVMVGAPNTVAIAVDTTSLDQKLAAEVRDGIAAEVLDGLRVAEIDFIPSEETKIVARVVDCAGIECLRNIAKSANLDWVVQVRVQAKGATKKGKTDYVVSMMVVRDTPNRGAWHEEADCPGCESSEIKHMASLIAGEIAGRIKVELSLMRATNVVRAIKGILGPKLAIPDDAIKPLGRGEQEADEDKAARERAVGHRLRDTPDVRFRKVEIELNGQCVLVLWGA